MNLIKIKICAIIILMSFSCSSQEDNEQIDKVLIDIGDSLTAGPGGEDSMSYVTSQLLGDEWVVKNMGVGGENTLTIGARQGGIPMYINESIILPKDGSKIKITSGLLSSYNNQNVYPLLQGSAGINPCYIDSIKCVLTLDAGNYYINRVSPSLNDYNTAPKTIIETALSKEKRGIATIFIGQNGGYDSPADLLNQIDLFVQHKGDLNVIIITSHDSSSPEIVDLINNKYGSKHIDLKAYMSTHAIYDAIEYGLLPDNGEYPTLEDLQRMQNTFAPSSLLNDGVHFNSIGYKLLGRLRYEKGKELGYW